MKKAVRSFRVHIDRPVVKAGRLLSGRISFCLRETVGVKSITLLFEGHSKTSYGCATTPLDGDGGGSPTYLFRVQVPMTPCLFEYEKDGKLKVPAGEHELPFGFPVPLASPTTFAGKHGYILYRCKAKLCTSLSLGQADFRAEAPFRVIGLEDLNWHPYTLLPVSWCDEYKRRVLCMTKTDVTVVMRLPRTGYALGKCRPPTSIVCSHAMRVVLSGARPQFAVNTVHGRRSRKRE
uniref:Arrestin-like N-terminal domain-containing protein n=1 Tax=Plectus sambesii TaxID=2011161 RepID=A0A914X244_9BILA